MALSAAQLARTRRLIDDVDSSTFTDADINDTADAMARTKDLAGLAPSHVGYVDTYDIYLLAAELWRIKAGFVAEQFDFRAEGGDFARSQKYRMYIAQAKRYSDMSSQKSANTGIPK